MIGTRVSTSLYLSCHSPTHIYTHTHSHTRVWSVKLAHIDKYSRTAVWERVLILVSNNRDQNCAAGVLYYNWTKAMSYRMRWKHFVLLTPGNVFDLIITRPQWLHSPTHAPTHHSDCTHPPTHPPQWLHSPTHPPTTVAALTHPPTHHSGCTH